MTARSGVELTTERLLLRELTDDDFEAVHEYASDPEVVRWMPWGPNTEQDTRDFLERSRADAAAEPRSSYGLGIVARSDGRLIGAGGLDVSGDGFQAMLGYCYASRAWGRGFATEAAEALVMFGFDVLLLHRIWAGCAPENVASAQVLTKLGMRLEGHLREDTRIRGEFYDTLTFGLLEREWRRERNTR